MSTESDALYSEDSFLLALKGQITVQFMDGNILEGEFVTQDKLNIFVMVDDEPMMIPRSQIRYIKGKPGQQPEPEQQIETASQPSLPEKDLEEIKIDTLDETDATFVLASEEELLDETMVLGEAVMAEEMAVTPEVSDLEDATFQLQDAAIAPEVSDLEDATFQIQDVGIAFDNDEDPTFVFKEEKPEAEEDDDTFVLAKKETEEISAYLECTTGPHASEVFQLTGGIITIGRSSDNIFSLPNDKEISRKHSKITYEFGNFIIEDQNSLNGTFVNEERVEGLRYLEEGDVIFVGVSTFVFHEK